MWSKLAVAVLLAILAVLWKMYLVYDRLPDTFNQIDRRFTEMEEDIQGKQRQIDELRAQVFYLKSHAETDR